MTGYTYSEDFPTKNAYDGSFNGRTNAFVVKFSNDIAPPIVTITAPADGETVNRDVFIKATAFDDLWIEKVEFYIDEKLITTKSMAPYSFVWESQKYTDGLYQILARVFDLAGNTSTDGVSIIVQNTKKTKMRR